MNKDFKNPSPHVQNSDTFTFIGRSRLARNFCFYFENLGLKYNLISSRDFQNSPFETLNLNSRCVFLSARDFENIENSRVLKKNLPQITQIHFSASTEIPEAWSWHPLSSFSERTKTFEELSQIPLVSDFETPPLEELMGLKKEFFINPRYRIPKEKRALYHGLATFTVSSTVLIWEFFTKIIQNQFNLPKDAGKALCKSVEQNLDFYFSNSELQTALTGPLARGDLKQFQFLLNSLNQIDPNIEKIFQAALQLRKDFHEPTQPEIRI